MSHESLIPLGIGVLVGLHVFSLNFFSMFFVYVVCDIEMFIVENEKSTPWYLLSCLRFNISNQFFNCFFNQFLKKCYFL
jgi:hypothetical protein